MPSEPSGVGGVWAAETLGLRLRSPSVTADEGVEAPDAGEDTAALAPAESALPFLLSLSDVMPASGGTDTVVEAADALVVPAV